MKATGRGWAAIVLGTLLGCGGNSASQSGPVLVSPAAPELHLEGRFESGSSNPGFELPGSAVWLRFQGTSVKATLGEHSLESDDYGNVAHNWYDVVVDGQPASAVQANEGVNTYVLAQGLAKGEHTLVLRRRTEAYVGEADFEGFELDPGAKALPVAVPSRRIEFVGDSITAGFGVDGPNRDCLFSAGTENYSHSYAALTAQSLGAEQIAVAASGAGVYRNWKGALDNTMGDLYLRALPTHSDSRWNFSRWKPDAVVLNLGTADFTGGDPGSAAFIGAYQALIAKVRQNYPSALVVVTLGPMLSDLWPPGVNALTQARSYLQILVADLNAAGDARVKMLEFENQDNAASFGCKVHPSAATQQQMADRLTAFLRTQLGW